jgi:hypothetical protein
VKSINPINPRFRQLGGEIVRITDGHGLPLPYREEPPESERATATVEVEVPTVEKPAAKVATVPLEIAASHSRPAAEPESQTSEPDPFDVWG